MGINDTATLDLIEFKSGHWLTVKELAKLLKAHPDTIRRWTKKEWLKCRRHPVNNYRLYLISDFLGAKIPRWKKEQLSM